MAASVAAPAPVLRAGASATTVIAQGQSRVWSLTLEKDQYIEIVAQQDGIDVTVYVHPAGAASPVETGSSAHEEEFSQDVLRYVAPASGPFELVVRGDFSRRANQTGRCELHVSPPRPAQERDRRAIALQSEAEKSTDYMAVARRWAEVDDPRGELLALLGAAASRRDSGFKVQDGERAIALAKRIADPGLHAFALAQTGTSRIYAGELDRGFEQVNASLAEMRKIGDVWGEAFLMIRTGSLMRVLGANERALELFQRVLPVAKEFAGRPRAVPARDGVLLRSVLLSIGGALTGSGRPDGALPYLYESLKLYRDIGDKRNETQLIGMIGRANLAAGKLGAARDYYEQSLALARRLGEAVVISQSAMNLASVLYRAGDFDPAAKLIEEAIALNVKHGNLVRLGGDYADLALVELGRGNSERALELTRQAVQTEQELQSKTTSSVLRSSSQTVARASYVAAAQVMIEVGRRRPDGRALYAEALAAAEMARSRALLDLLNTARIDILSLAPAPLAARERELAADLARNGNRQAKARAAGVQAELLELEREFHQLARELEANREAMRQANPAFAAALQTGVLTWPQIRERVLGPDDLLLEYQVGQNGSYVWAGTRDTLEVHQLPARAVLEGLVKRFAAAVRAHEAHPPGETVTAARRRRDRADAEIRAAGQELGKALLGPVSKLLSKKRWLVAPDEDLYALSFSAMAWMSGFGLPEGGVLHVPSASAAGQARSGDRAALSSIAIVSDPVFHLGDRRPEVRSGSALRGGVMPAPWKPRRLPFSRREADAIRALAGTRKVLFATGLDANRELVVGGALNHYSVLHFATHGLLNTDFVELSGVALSSVDSRGRIVDGMVRLQDLLRLNLDAELAVLSACDTAGGVYQTGEGVVGLTRGMLAAGARQVVSSLWKVDDAATAEFMKHYYQALFTEAKPAPAALIEAQRRTAANPRFSSPYHWAAFLLTGVSH